LLGSQTSPVNSRRVSLVSTIWSRCTQHTPADRRSRRTDEAEEMGKREKERGTVLRLFSQGRRAYYDTATAKGGFVTSVDRSMAASSPVSIGPRQLDHPTVCRCRKPSNLNHYLIQIRELFKPHTTVTHLNWDAGETGGTSSRNRSPHSSELASETAQSDFRLVCPDSAPALCLKRIDTVLLPA